MIERYKKEIEAAYPFRTELHAHTAPSSPCSSLDAKALIQVLVREGIHAAVLTNHFGPYHMALYPSKEAFIEQYISDYRSLKNEAEKHGITALFGIELRFQENKNDYLVLGIGEDALSRVYDAVEGGLSRFREVFPSENVLILQAHPDRDGIEHADAAYLDGAEVFNLYPGYNPHTTATAKWAKQSNLSILVGGSDLHHAGGEGACLLRSKERPDSMESLVSILKSKDFALEIGGSIVLP
jgi:hypothetical protein